MNGQLEMIQGTNRDTSLSQWFTPPALAAKVVEWALAGSITVPGHGAKGMRVLEPSAGNGALVLPLVAAGAEVTAVEIDDRYLGDLRALHGLHTVIVADFLQTEPPSRGFDLCVMNPPYEDGQDVAFILHALKFAPRVVGIFTDRILFGVERKEGLWSQVRPTRIAFQSRRPFKGAQTDYVVAELIERIWDDPKPDACKLEWW